MKKNRLLVIFITIVLMACKPTQESEQVAEHVGVKDDSILLGSSSALSGHAGFLGTEYLKGASMYFNEINKQGGVHGRLITVVDFDDAYDPAATVSNTQRLIGEEQVFALFNYVGTPTSVAVKPIIQNAKIPIVGFFTGAEPLRNPSNEYFFHLRDSYYAEAEGLVAYYVDQLGLKRVGVFYQDDAFGVAVLKGIQLALQRRGMVPALTDSYPRGSMEIDENVEYMSQEAIDAIIMVGTYSPLAKFIKQSHNAGHSPQFSTVSFIGSEAFAHELLSVQEVDEKYHKDIIVTQVVPSPYSEHEGSKEYLKLYTQYYPDSAPNYVALEGYLNARIIVEGLERAGKELTRTGFCEALREIKNYDLGIGKSISYGPDDQEGISGIYYSTLDENGRFKVIEGK